MKNKKSEPRTVIHDPRVLPKREDFVIIDNEVLTVEFTNVVGPTVHLIGYRTTGPEAQRVVELKEWQEMCKNADGAVDPTADFN